MTTVILTLLLFTFVNLLLDPGPYPREYNPQLRVTYKDTDHVIPSTTVVKAPPVTKGKRTTNKRIDN